jgi:hypothetical protein
MGTVPERIRGERLASVEELITHMHFIGRSEGIEVRAASIRAEDPRFGPLGPERWAVLPRVCGGLLLASVTRSDNGGIRRVDAGLHFPEEWRSALSCVTFRPYFSGAEPTPSVVDPEQEGVQLDELLEGAHTQGGLRTFTLHGAYVELKIQEHADLPAVCLEN